MMCLHVSIGCVFRGDVDAAQHFGGHVSKKPYRGMNRLFSNVQNIQSFILSKLLHGFKPHFAQ